jgi:hypothetical protein
MAERTSFLPCAIVLPSLDILKVVKKTIDEEAKN